jgi:PKD repeat protein/streptogramin lyase
MSGRIRRIGAIALAVVCAAVVGPCPSGAADGTSEVLLEEGFEQVFPRLPWRVSHAAGSAAVDWGRTNHRASEGVWSIYCAGMGPAAPAAGGPAPAFTASWAIAGPYDLGETTAGTLTFDLWLRTEPYRDVFMWLVSTDGETFSGSALSTDTDGWETISADLASWGAAGSVIGETEVWIAFVYQSDHNELFEGAYVDRVRLEVDLGATGDEGRTYTSDADFDEGTMVGVESASNRLELADAWDTLPYLWVPNSLSATVSKVDALTGDELGRYRTGPTADAAPAVAAVDLEGSCWVGNRGAGTVVKIGLAENGGCRDRDGDGEIETSTDRNDDGNISGSELLAWGDDECALVEVSLVEGEEGTHVPGEEHDDYEANGLQAVAVDEAGDVWAGVYASLMLYRLDGGSGEVLKSVDLASDATYPTGAVVDPDGTLWLSSWPDPWVLGVETATGDRQVVELGHGSGAVAVDDTDGLFVTGLESQVFSKVDTATGEVAWTQPAGYLANGIATTEEGRVWIAAVGHGTVSRYNRDGVLTRSVNLPNGPNGLAVDQDGKVWVIGALTDVIYRLDPDAVVSDLAKELVGTGGHAATGDLTGIVARNLTTRFGTWTVVHDSQVAGTPWGRVSWQATAPVGTSVRVRARSSEDEESWSIWESAANGVDLAATPAGRYIEIEVAMQQASGDDLPRLDELTVIPVAVVSQPDAAFSWSPTAPTAGSAVLFADGSTGDPTTWSWDFGDGGQSDQPNPSHTFSQAGSFQVSLTVTNSAGSDTAVETVVVGPGSGCTVACSATAPPTAILSEPVAFTAEATPSGCTGEVAFAWSFGDGATSVEPSPTHTYGSIGTLRWGLTVTVDDASCSRAGDITISGDGPAECSHTAWVPVVSRSNGANGSVWRSNVGLLGVDPDGAAVELRLHRAGSVASRSVTVVEGAMVSLVDVVDWIEPGSTGSGALEVCADGEVVVDSRTYNRLAANHACTPGGTFGQYLAGAAAEAGLAAGETARLGMLRESAAFRTNIGVVNAGAATAVVRIELFDATGAELAEIELELEPGRWRQENRPFATRAGREDLEAASARVTVVSGSGVVAYASVVDNLTNDATTIPMR